MCATVVSILCTIVAETEEEQNHGQSLPLGRLSQFHPYHILAYYFPVIQPTNLLSLSGEFCPRGSARQAIHIPRASHPIHMPQSIVAFNTKQTPCIINEVSRHVTLNSPLTSRFSWPNIFLSAVFLNVPSKQRAWFTQIKTTTSMCSFVHSDFQRLFKSHGTIKVFEINM
jgi:hypothetical protein